MLLGLYIVTLFTIMIIIFLLPETVLYNDSLWEVINNNSDSKINNNTDSKIINHKFNYIRNIAKYTPTFIMRDTSHYSPILDAALNSSLDWGKATSLIEKTIDLKRPSTSGTSFSKNDSVMGTVYNAIHNGSSGIFSPFIPSTYVELNKEIANVASNLQFIEESCNTPERRNSLIEKTIDYSLYLLNQKHSHLDAIQKLAADTSISQKDYDELVENYHSLKNDLKDLSKRLDNLKERSLLNKK